MSYATLADLCALGLSVRDVPRVAKLDRPRPVRRARLSTHDTRPVSYVVVTLLACRCGAKLVGPRALIIAPRYYWEHDLEITEAALFALKHEECNA